MRNIFLVFLTVLFVSAGTNESKAEICLDYWLKGPAACKTKKPKKKPQKIYIKGSVNGRFPKAERDAERLKYEKDLNIKIDKFLANYGKPPREFVAFNMDPTLENALRWVKKFNTDYERTEKVAIVWQQAQEIFEEYRDTGDVVISEKSGVTPDQVKYIKEVLDEAPTDLPPVKGFDVDIEGERDNDVLEQNYARLSYKERKDHYKNSVSRLSATGGDSRFSLKALEERMAKDKKKYQKTKALEKELTKMKGNFPLEVSFYYSEKCPYCIKYKPQLKAAIEKVGKKNIKLTCVDMTPGAKDSSKVKDLGCKWRPIMSGEMREYGVKRTPSLLVKRANSNSLELLENYHKSSDLVRYFTKGN